MKRDKAAVRTPEVSKTSNARYAKLRWAVRFFVAALLPFLVAAALVFVGAMWTPRG